MKTRTRIPIRATLSAAERRAAAQARRDEIGVALLVTAMQLFDLPPVLFDDVNVDFDDPLLAVVAALQTDMPITEALSFVRDDGGHRQRLRQDRVEVRAHMASDMRAIRRLLKTYRTLQDLKQSCAPKPRQRKAVG